MKVLPVIDDEYYYTITTAQALFAVVRWISVGLEPLEEDPGYADFVAYYKEVTGPIKYMTLKERLRVESDAVSALMQKLGNPSPVRGNTKRFKVNDKVFELIKSQLKKASYFSLNSRY